MGCLKSLIFKLGSLVLLVGLAAVAWLYRDQLSDRIRLWRAGKGDVYAPPAPGGAQPAESALADLARAGGPAYRDLTPGDIAGLVDAALARTGPKVFDSVQVALIEGEIRVRGSIDLSGVPRNLLGPLASAVRGREPASIGGPLSVDSAGRLLLTVTYLKLRDFPFPRATIPRILEAAKVPGAEGASVPLPVRTRLGDVRVTPAYVRIYRVSPH